MEKLLKEAFEAGELLGAFVVSELAEEFRPSSFDEWYKKKSHPSKKLTVEIVQDLPEICCATCKYVDLNVYDDPCESCRGFENHEKRNINFI